MTTASSSSARAGDAANDAFLSALVRGDEAAARSALASGADVNATDANGRTSLGCALVGANWETVDAQEMHARLGLVRLLVSHPNVTLYTLNAPQADMRDVTPLGIASWSNAVEVVKACLELGAGAVAVDARDGHSATPLMYAARDARSEVVDELLAHGALPDARDVNLISAVQYALPHTEVLRACEDALRGARTRESLAANPRKLAFSPEALPPAFLSRSSDVPPPLPTKDHNTPIDDTALATTTANVVKAVIGSDVPTLVSLLFPSALDATTPTLVNRADKDEWSPVHYCASVRNPSVAVLDALFLAGADVNLSSNQGECTPLHCLARKRRGPDALRGAQANTQLYDFVVHLIRDLGAPLAKRSASRETCIHIAAEHGDSAEVLRALLDCDVDRTVCELRNIRGLTALEVAKPEFRYLFGARDEPNRPTSAASHLTVTPLRLLRQRASSHSILSVAPSVAASTVLASPVLGPGSTESAPESPADAFERAVRGLRWVTDQLALADDSQTADLDHIEARLRDAQTRAIASLGQFRSRTEDVAARLARTNTPWTETDALLDALAQSLDDKEKLRVSATEPEFAGRARSGTTFSADSARTAVSEASSTAEAPLAFPSLSPELDWDGTRPTTPYSRLKSYKSMSDIAQRGRQDSTPSPSFTALSASPVPSMSMSPSPVSSGARDSPTPGVRRARADTIASARPHTPPIVQPAADKDNTGKRLKAWLKKKLIPERPAPATSSLKALKSEEPPMRTSLSTLCEMPAEEDAASASTVSPAKRALSAVQRDLARMDEAVADASTLLAGARRGASRAERLLGKAVERRAGELRQHRLARRVDAGLQALMAWDQSPPGPLSLAIPSMDSSRATSVPTTPSDLGTPHELPTSPAVRGTELDDAGQLERLVWWKVEERIETALDAAERVEVWLDVARDVLRGVQLREGLVLEPVAI